MIAEKLEVICPEPALHIDHVQQEEIQGAMMGVFIPSGSYLTYVSMKNVVAPEDLDWFKKDRATRFEQFEEAKCPENSYALARPSFDKCTKGLTVHKLDEGPFISGSVPCYSDFSRVAKILMILCFGPDIERFLEEAGSETTALYKACEK